MSVTENVASSSTNANVCHRVENNERNTVTLLVRVSGCESVASGFAFFTFFLLDYDCLGSRVVRGCSLSDGDNTLATHENWKEPITERLFSFEARLALLRLLPNLDCVGYLFIEKTIHIFIGLVFPA